MANMAPQGPFRHACRPAKPTHAHLIRQAGGADRCARRTRDEVAQVPDGARFLAVAGFFFGAGGGAGGSGPRSSALRRPPMNS